MNDFTDPQRKESLVKTFARGVLGGLGWVIGLTIGWALLAIALFEFNRRFQILPKVQSYLQQVISDVTYQQLEKQTDLLQNMLPEGSNLLPPDTYPANFQEILKKNQ